MHNLSMKIGFFLVVLSLILATKATHHELDDTWYFYKHIRDLLLKRRFVTCLPISSAAEIP